MKTRPNLRVLFFSPFFFPEQISTGKYNTTLAEALVESGCEIHAVSSHPLYPAWIPKEDNSALNQITIHRAGLKIRYPASPILRRAFLEIWFSFHAIATIRRIGMDFNCIVAIFPPSLFFLGLNILLPHRIKKIGIVHDLQGVYVKRSQGVISKFISWGIHRIERIVFQGCDKVIFLSNSMKKVALREYSLNESRCTVCYPFVTIPKESKTVTNELDQLFPSNKFHVVYSGALGEKQNPNGLFLFMEKLAIQHKEISCHIFSGGPIYEALQSKEGNSRHVLFHDLVPAEQLNELYSHSCIQIIPQAHGTSEGSLPSKLPNLLASGVPVFAICDAESETGKLVEMSGNGHVAHTWDLDLLVTDINFFINKLKSKPRQSQQMELAEYIEELFGVGNVVKEIIKECY